MRIGDRTVLTPDADSIGYDLSWRSRLADAAVVSGDKGAVNRIKDSDARALARHLQHRQTSQLKENERPNMYDRLSSWKASETGMLVEAFLIAGNYESTAVELGLPVDDVRLYSRLWYDVMDDQGQVRPGVRMRILAALEGQDAVDIGTRLKRVAITAGLHGLRQVLRILKPQKTEPTLDEMVELELRRRLVAGELRNADLVRLRLTEDRKAEGQPKMAENLALVRRMLSMAAPEMVRAPERTPEALRAGTDAIQSRLKSQCQINATPLNDDNGEGGVARLSAKMKQQFGRA